MLVQRGAHGVPPVLELTAQRGHQRVADRLTAVVRLEVSLGHVGRVVSPVDEHVIPRAVLRRARPRHQLVPLVGALKRGIDVEDDTPVVELRVVDDLADEEPGGVLHGRSRYHARGVPA